MSSPVPPDAQPVEDYTGLLMTAMSEVHFAALTVAAAQAVAHIWNDANASPALKGWCIQHANNQQKIDGAIRSYLVFIVTEPTLLPYKGALASAPLVTVRDVLVSLLGSFVQAGLAARQAGAA